MESKIHNHDLLAKMKKKGIRRDLLFNLLQLLLQKLQYPVEGICLPTTSVTEQNNGIMLGCTTKAEM